VQQYPLKDDIYWVGAIDWDVRDFHGYETSRGSTYNAYLIVDEKVTLVDGCRDGFGPELLRRVASITDPASIEYLVINHIEMDHSGALPWLIERIKPARIFASKRAKEGLLRHYPAEGVDQWDITVVSSGDELTLGRHTLSFLEAPMVHWPDSMFTYVKEAKVLLPNDAFGQHLATSSRFADECDMAVVMDEASRYYANILMPFGAPIAKTLGKVAELGLEIDVIGPSHGVVWRRPEDVARIIDAYTRWTRMEAEPRVTIVYDTMWHSTEKMTRAIEEGIAQEGVPCQVMRLGATPLADCTQAVLLSRGFLIGTPTLNNNLFPSVAAFLAYIKGLRPKERVAGAFGSFGWSGGAAKQVDAELRTLGLDVVDPLEIKFVPDEADLAVCTEYGREIARRVKAWGSA
jgi:anaerobic nitric oxide reductase flavorubredoxin